MKIVLIICIFLLYGCSDYKKFPKEIVYAYGKRCAFLGSNCYDFTEKLEAYKIERVGNDCKYYIPKYDKEIWEKCIIATSPTV